VKYLYGDATESPLEVNYLELLRDVLDFSVGVVSAAAAVRKMLTRAAEVERATSSELRSLRELAQALGVTLDRFESKEAPPAFEGCLKSIRQAALNEVQRAERGVQAAVDAEVDGIRRAAERQKRSHLELLEALLLRHDLPSSEAWIDLNLGGTGYVAERRGKALCGVAWTMALDIPDGHLFREVLRVDKLAPQLGVQLPEESGWVRKSMKMRVHKLGKEHVVSMSKQAGHTVVALRDAPREGDSGFDLSFDSRAIPKSIRRVAKGGSGEAFEPQPEDEEALQAFYLRLDTALGELARHRRSLVEARLDDQDFGEHPEPVVVVQRLVAEMAPIVQEIGRHTLGPKELVLKRVLGDDRREEIFVAKKDLREKLSPLEPSQRRLFIPFGILTDEDVAASMAASTPPPKPIAQTQAGIGPSDKDEPRPSSPRSSPPRSDAPPPSNAGRRQAPSPPTRLVPPKPLDPAKPPSMAPPSAPSQPGPPSSPAPSLPPSRVPTLPPPPPPGHSQPAGPSAPPRPLPSVPAPSKPPPKRRKGPPPIPERPAQPPIDGSIEVPIEDFDD
jgi:hypothetical protein